MRAQLNHAREVRSIDVIRIVSEQLGVEFDHLGNRRGRWHGDAARGQVAAEPVNELRVQRAGQVGDAVFAQLGVRCEIGPAHHRDRGTDAVPVQDEIEALLR
jgi:hypothetical protein